VLPAGEEPNHNDASKLSSAHEIVELVVLTADEQFLAVLRDAVGSSTRLWHVPSADKVSDLLLAGDVGILVLDGATLPGSNASFIEQLKRQFPELVVLFAGTRDDESMLSGLISSGTVYRFIHKPMSSARARLFVQAAIRKHEDPRSTMVLPAMAKPAAPRDWRLIGGAAGALLLITAGAVAWRMFGAKPAPDAPPAVAAEDVSLQRAANALAANHLTEPAGDNALELYRSKLARSPGDAMAKAGVLEVHERLLSRAENALLEERLDEAQAAIDEARRAGVEGGRIAFLMAQLNKAREQSKLSQARVRVQTEQRASGDQLSQALRSAAQRMDQDRLLEPESDSALFYVRQAMQANPNDLSTQQAKRALGARLLLDARAAIQARDFDKTNRLLQAAAGFATQADIDATRTALSSARSEMQTEGRDKLLKLANERLQQDRLIDPANDNAKYYLGSLRALDPAFPGLAAATGDYGSRLLTKARRALGLKQNEAARTWLDEAAAAGAGAGEIAALRMELDSAGGATATGQEAGTIVGASTLTRVATEQPEYPVEAARKRQEGWVDLEFTIKPDGSVQDAVIRNAQPAGVFDQAAVKAVQKWRFKPVLREGKAVEQRARIRVRFSLKS
jgi:TonB family protein